MLRPVAFAVLVSAGHAAVPADKVDQVSVPDISNLAWKVLPELVQAAASCTVACALERLPMCNTPALAASGV